MRTARDCRPHSVCLKKVILKGCLHGANIADLAVFDLHGEIVEVKEAVFLLFDKAANGWIFCDCHGEEIPEVFFQVVGFFQNRVVEHSGKVSAEQYVFEKGVGEKLLQNFPFRFLGRGLTNGKGAL